MRLKTEGEIRAKIWVILLLHAMNFDQTIFQFMTSSIEADIDNVLLCVLYVVL